MHCQVRKCPPCSTGKLRPSWTGHDTCAGAPRCMWLMQRALKPLQVNEAKGAEGLGEMKKAYEYALERVGCDLNAGALWQDYIELLQVLQISMRWPFCPHALQTELEEDSISNDHSAIQQSFQCRACPV